MAMLTYERLKELVDYDPSTGFLTARTSRGRKAKGARLGNVHKKSGYRQVGLDGEVFWEHRIVWLFMTGEWPSGEVDHWNRKRAENWWSNLRLGTDAQTTHNRVRKGREGLTGTYKSGDHWRANIKIKGKSKCLGAFDTVEEAHNAYLKAANEAYGDFSIGVPCQSQ